MDNLEDARNLYGEWFTDHPDIKNPTDKNRPEKSEWFENRSDHDYQLMQRARKTKQPFSRAEYWKEASDG